MPLGIVIWVQCKFVDSWQCHQKKRDQTTTRPPQVDFTLAGRKSDNHTLKKHHNNIQTDRPAQ